MVTHSFSSTVSHPAGRPTDAFGFPSQKGPGSDGYTALGRAREETSRAEFRFPSGRETATRCRTDSNHATTLTKAIACRAERPGPERACERMRMLGHPSVPPGAPRTPTAEPSRRCARRAWHCWPKTPAAAAWQTPPRPKPPARSHRPGNGNLSQSQRQPRRTVAWRPLRSSGPSQFRTNRAFPLAG